jgi:hypothetical protein
MTWRALPRTVRPSRPRSELRTTTLARIELRMGSGTLCSASGEARNWMCSIRLAFQGAYRKASAQPNIRTMLSSTEETASHRPRSVELLAIIPRATAPSTMETQPRVPTETTVTISAAMASRLTRLGPRPSRSAG